MKLSDSILFLLPVILSCKTAYTVQKTENAEYVFSDTSNTTVDSTVISYIAPYRERLDKEMNVVIAESAQAMEKGLPESVLGNFVADACLEEAALSYSPADKHPVDFAFLNNGGLRRSLPMGKILRKDVYELMPFENELVVLTLDGNLVRKIFNFIASKGGGPVSGVRFRIQDKEAMDITINGEPLDSTRSYKALTSDYLANGGDSFKMITGVPRDYLNLKVRDAILQYLIKKGKEETVIRAGVDGRITNAR
jgi:2',3'-cyclic-nucleotide 2'-phosphodiesterase (5'-nucleotidase family)